MTLPELRWALKNADSAALILPKGGDVAVSLHHCTAAELDLVEQLIRERGETPKRHLFRAEGEVVYHQVANHYSARVKIAAYESWRQGTAEELRRLAEVESSVSVEVS